MEMTFRCSTAPTPDLVFAAARLDAGVIYYVGLAVVVAILVVTLIGFYRTWMEIHEDEEPDSPEDMLDSFREAHAAGQIDDRELERLQKLLSVGGGEAVGRSGRLQGSRPASGGGHRGEATETVEPDGNESRSV
jgi:hypothetical protein